MAKYRDDSDRPMYDISMCTVNMNGADLMRMFGAIKSKIYMTKCKEMDFLPQAMR